jgi:acyl-CoA dehydrogenase
LKEVAEKQRLIASVTSEVGIGGDTRSSITHVQRDGDKFTLDKDATTISYGAYADDLLITSRRAKESPPSDQSLTLVRGAGYNEYTLENKGVWDTLGMRGTCSEPAMVRSHGAVDHILPVPYGEISSRTMTPFSHILWASAWLGIAGDAVARARAYVRGEARK